jgi:phosphoadenosine phosphosulfate reductase
MTELDLQRVREDLSAAGPERTLAWAVSAFGERVALASSFGVEDVALVDMLTRVASRARIFAIDTGRLPEATYEVMEAVRERYGVTIEVHYPEREAVERLERQDGFFSFRRSLEARHECCNIRKVEPLRRALAGLDAWITGLRQEQSVTRSAVQVLEIDHAHGGIIKVSPLASWSEQQVWDYVRRHDVPYNRLHDAGYPSIGCDPCTRAIGPGEHARAGRWWWEDPAQKECGLHAHAKGSG